MHVVGKSNAPGCTFTKVAITSPRPPPAFTGRSSGALDEERLPGVGRLDLREVLRLLGGMAKSRAMRSTKTLYFSGPCARGEEPLAEAGGRLGRVGEATTGRRRRGLSPRLLQSRSRCSWKGYRKVSSVPGSRLGSRGFGARWQETALGALLRLASAGLAGCKGKIAKAEAAIAPRESAVVDAGAAKPACPAPEPARSRLSRWRRRSSRPTSRSSWTRAAHSRRSRTKILALSRGTSQALSGSVSTAIKQFDVGLRDRTPPPIAPGAVL